jgi:aminocarboxymuconate-semialdehyde decarboxylase
MQTGAIDIHHHYVPELLVQEAKRHGKSLGVEVVEGKDGSPGFTFAGVPGRELQDGVTDVDQRLEMMKKDKIAMAALDPTTNSVGYKLKGEQAENWCCLHNECTKELLKQYPNRFTAMAAVPMQEPVRAAKVLEHAIVDLKFSGAFIGTNVNHHYYDSKDFDPFWGKAQELDVLVVMHPDNVAGTELMGGYGLRLVCGNPADTTLSLGFMIYSGVFDRFPNLKLCTFHGGGFLPYHFGRFDREFDTGKEAGRPKDRPQAIACASRPSAYLKNLYFDTLVYDVATLDFLRRKVGADHVLLGTDYPYMLGDWMCVDKVEALPCPEAEKEAILWGNARRVLKL